jgi:hypothetical protein
MSLVITAGQRGDSPRFQVVLGRIRVPRLGPGRPRTRPDKARADKAYGSRANRAYLRKRGIRCTIPEKRDQLAVRYEATVLVAAINEWRELMLSTARGVLQDYAAYDFGGVSFSPD